jgi:hypothetical protein
MARGIEVGMIEVVSHIRLSLKVGRDMESNDIVKSD